MHTKGPWQSSYSMVSGRYAIRQANENPIFTVFSIDKGVLPIKEDSCIIAAAPDLLEACKAAFDLIRESGFSSGLEECVFDRTFEHIGKAIAKAEGKVLQ